MTEILLLTAAVLLVGLGGLFAALDAALGVTSKSDLIVIADEARNGPALYKIADSLDAHINAVVFLRIFVETASAVLVTAAFVLLFDNVWWAMLASALLMTVVTFVLVTASPRSVGRRHAKPLLRACAPLIRFARILLGPLAGALLHLGDRVAPAQQRRASFTSEEQLLSMVDEAAEAELIEDDDRELIHSVFDFTDRYVREVMIPRIDMVTIDSTANTDEAMDLFLATGVSRVPVVVDDDADEVAGFLYLKDLVQLGYAATDRWRTQPISTIVRTPVFVPESMKAETLLQQMKRDAVHVCMVVDEHGGTAGLVTLEDLLEELVGDIADEYDRDPDEVTEVEPGRYRVTARLPLDELGDLFGIDVEDEDVDTVGGLLGKALGRVPQPGAQATSKGIRMTGGASKGRGRGISTVFVEAADPELAGLRNRTGPIPAERSSRRRGEDRHG